ncbi:RNA-directed DNA polymerase [Aurantimicrobium photophilum]|uniref:Reverse transcriptase (RNA-dependent DNA polymerase) n=1 Tax=Aurantimicrobium photophilum TaxID=1987356 RepID=A0A2Z3RXR8_9MICO|nr:RNA-directed DNA polymerase [Aurantimicrobium photophilum]AWR21321.1 Reverse transcriptase (RNA-dependent DNA polymerase) [Aurantimicrobium photophilum]
MDNFEDEGFELGQEGDLIELPTLGLSTTFGADGYPILTKEILRHSLLSANYFPRMKARKTELPSLFTTSDFTPEVSNQLLGRDRLANTRAKRGFGAVSYGQTRHEGSVRVTHIPHPWSHCNVVNALIEGWEALEPLSLNKNSAIRPMVFRDGRVFVSNYSDGLYPEDNWDEISEFGATHRAKFDIKEFYPSIYTHTLAWAALGRDFVQANLKSDAVRNHFSTKVENALLDSNRKMSKGILIGPATSNLVAEYLLSGVDAKLREFFDNRFRRHIDDYTFYAQSRAEVTRFQSILENELSKLQLSINPHKTLMETVDIPASPKWLLELNEIDVHDLNSPESLLKYWVKAEKLSEDINAGMALRYGMRAVLRQAIRLNQTKWAATLLILEIQTHQYLTPLLDEFIDFVPEINEADLCALQIWLKSEYQFLNSDSRAWVLMILGIAGFIDDELIDILISIPDVVPMTVAYEFRKDKASNFRQAVIRDPNDVCKADEYWLLAYQLFLNGEISKDEDGVFEILKNNNVNFVNNKWSF